MRCVLSAILVLSSISTFGAVPLPMTDRTVSAFFRFDDPSVWGMDSGPLGSSLSSKSGSSSAGLKTGDGSIVDAGCLNLPYASRDWSLSGYTYTPSTVSGTIAGSVPDLGNPSNGWTLALWVRLDQNMLEQRTTLKGVRGNRGTDPCDTVGVIRLMEIGVARGCD